MPARSAIGAVILQVKAGVATCVGRGKRAGAAQVAEAADLPAVADLGAPSAVRGLGKIGLAAAVRVIAAAVLEAIFAAARDVDALTLLTVDGRVWPDVGQLPAAVAARRVR